MQTLHIFCLVSVTDLTVVHVYPDVPYTDCIKAAIPRTQL